MAKRYSQNSLIVEIVADTGVILDAGIDRNRHMS